MAFVLEQRWETEAPRRTRSPAPARVTPAAPAGGDTTRRLDAFGLGLTALVHLLLFVLIVRQLFGPAPPAAGHHPGSSLTLVDLSASAEQAPAPAATASPPVPSPPVAPPALIPLPDAASEWSTAKVRVPMPVSAALPGGAAMGSDGPGTGAGGGSNYDPYAGAAAILQPSWNQPPPAMGAPKASEALAVSAVIARIVAVVRARQPTARGTGLFKVRTAVDGTVSDVRYVHGSMAPDTIALVVSLLRGIRIDPADVARSRGEIGPIVL